MAEEEMREQQANGAEAEISSELAVIKIGGDQVTQVTRELPEEQKEAVRWLYSLARGQGWSLARLHQETGIDNSTLHRVFSGNYGAKLDKITERIERYRSQFEDRSRRQRKFFVKTSMSEMMWDAYDFARHSKTMVMIYGPSHFGKTTSAECYKDIPKNNHGSTKYWRMPASAGVQLMMKEFARACFVSPNSCFENLRDYVFKAIDETHLIIVDQVHEIFQSYQRGSAIKCLGVLMEVHDRRGCGMVFQGTNKLEEEMMMGDHKDLLHQFKERCVLEVQLPMTLPKKDIMKIAGAFGLGEVPGDPNDAHSPASVLKTVTLGHGLKRLVLHLEHGSNLAKKEGKKMSWDYFVRAHDIVARLKKRDKGSKMSGGMA